MKVTFAVVWPRNSASTAPPASIFNAGIRLSNFTSPGPRYFDHSISTGGGRLRGCAFEPLVNLPSSTAHVVIGSGTPTFACIVGALATVAIGPWIGGPVAEKRMIGGVLPTATSLNGWRI